MHIERHDLNIFTKYVNSRFSASWIRPSHASPSSAARPPGGGPHCALNLDYLRLPDFCAGVQPFAETRKSLEGSSEPWREVHAVGAAQISGRFTVNLAEKSSVFPIPL